MKKNLSARVISFFMSFMMLFQLLPITVFAAMNPPTINSVGGIEVEQETNMGGAPTVIIGEEYSAQVVATGADLTYTAGAGSYMKLPAGLTINPETGLISGTCTDEIGRYEVYIEVSNAAGAAHAVVGFTVGDSSLAPTIKTEAGSLGTAYKDTSGMFKVSMNNENAQASDVYGFEWSLVSGSLPIGMNLTYTKMPDVYISGIPTETGTFNFELKAQNDFGSETKSFSIEVIEGEVRPEIIEPANQQIGNAIIGQSFEYQFEATGTNTLENPILWSIDEDDFTQESYELGKGLSMSKTGFISGIPTATGTVSFTIYAKNSKGKDSVYAFINIHENGEASSISISPEIVVLERGASQEFTVSLEGYGDVEQVGYWGFYMWDGELGGPFPSPTDSELSIDDPDTPSGSVILTIGENEERKEFRVVAYSLRGNNGVRDYATVYLSDVDCKFITQPQSKGLAVDEPFYPKWELNFIPDEVIIEYYNEGEWSYFNVANATGGTILAQTEPLTLRVKATKHGEAIYSDTFEVSWEDNYEFSVTPNTIEWGNVDWTGSYSEKTATIENIGTKTFYVECSTNDEFNISIDNVNNALMPGEQTILHITPKQDITAGNHNFNLTLKSTDGDEKWSMNLPVSINVVAPTFTTAPQGGTVTVDNTHAVNFAFDKEPDSIELQWYNDYSDAWAPVIGVELESNATSATIPAEDSAQTKQYRILATYGLNTISSEFEVTWEEPAPTTYTLHCYAYNITDNGDAGKVSLETDLESAEGALAEADATENTSVTIKAVANSGYEFVEWRKGGPENPTFSANANSTFDATESVWYYAIFQKISTTEITEITVTGIKAPIAEEMPDVSEVTITTEGITMGTIQWEKNGAKQNEVFEDGTQYMLYVGYDIDEGYVLANELEYNPNITAEETREGVKWIGFYYTAKLPTYTVEFEVGEGSEVDSQIITAGEKAEKPATDPTRSGYVFDGWYTDENYTLEFDFDTAINEDTKIYAKWKKEITEITVTGIKAPIAGEMPDVSEVTITTDGITPGTIQWEKNGTKQNEVFEVGTQYMLYVGYDIDEGYVLANELEYNPNITAEETREGVEWAGFYYTASSLNPTKCTITWVDEDGQTELEKDENVIVGTMPEYNGSEPTKAEDAENTYTFAGWTPEVVAVTGDATYKATYNTVPKAKYTITWVDEDGQTELEKDENVVVGTMPEYNGSEPTKAEDAENTYTFAGWTPEVVAVAGDATYKATYDAVPKAKYTITWVDEDGQTELEKDENVIVGTMPSYDSAEPTKAEDTENTYTFAGWTPEVVAVAGDATYKATYNTVPKAKYTITWVDEDGQTELEKDENVIVGTMPSYDSAEPTKAEDAENTYTFAGWTPEVVAVTEDATYKATYNAVPKAKYTITWADEDGQTELEKDENVIVGTMPSYDGNEPTKAEDTENTYTFAGWTPEVVAVTGDATYKATYNATPKTPQPTTYTVTFESNGGSAVTAIENVTSGEKISKPTDPTRTGYTFAGWYKDAELTKKFNFTTDTITEDITLYAKWNKKQTTGGGGGGGSTTTKYTITVKQNDNGKISPETTKVEKGDNQKFEIKADKGYEVEKVLVDGKSVGAVTEYTFEKVKEKHTIEATFKKVEEVTEETWKNPFTDVTEDDWFYEAVKYANENKLFNGVSSTEFGPNVSMTRAMLVTVLYRLEGEPATNRSIPFADVDMSMYYANAVIWAKQNNIVNGVDETNFAPNLEVTREQLVTILYRYAQYKGKDVSVGENTNILSYDDFSELSEYAIPAMQWACGSGIITGRTTSTIAPKGTATRAEVATMLMRFTK